MNKAEFIDAVAAKAGLSKKDAKGAVDAVLDTITEALVKKESVSFIGFGTFAVLRTAGPGQNHPCFYYRQGNGQQH